VVFAYHDVGVRCLQVLLARGVEVALVVTHHDNPAETIWFESVAALAAEHGLACIAPDQPGDPALHAAVAAARPDFIFSFYYRHMLPAALLALAPRGAFNMHGSLLPAFRGRVPVNWAVLHGATETGATLHEMVAKPDAGAIIGQTADLAPADRRLYAIRDVTATVESIPLITASILSKKLAAGVQALVMDIKTGNGAFMATEADARGLGEAMIGAGKAMGLPVRVMITDMSENLGTAAGNALEVRECLDWLTGASREVRLDTVTRALAAEMLALGGIEDGAAKIDGAIASGAVAEHFAKMVAAQGGPADLIDRPNAYLAKAPVIRPIPSPASGTVRAVNARAVGEPIVALGGGRRRITDTIDLSVGYAGTLPVGTAVEAGQPLAFVHAASEDAANQGVADYLAACSVGEGTADSHRLIRAILS